MAKAMEWLPYDPPPGAFNAGQCWVGRDGRFYVAHLVDGKVRVAAVETEDTTKLALQRTKRANGEQPVPKHRHTINPGDGGYLNIGGSGVGTDELVKVSANDTTAGYLNGKLVAGTGIALTEGNDGADETLEIASDGTVPAHAHDHDSLTNVTADQHHAEDHDHDGSPTQKLKQANTHELADTDAAASSIHHTLGTTSTQAAAGDHTHADLHTRKHDLTSSSDHNATGDAPSEGDLLVYDGTNWDPGRIVTAVENSTGDGAVGLGLRRKMSDAAVDGDGVVLLGYLTDAHGADSALGGVGFARDGADNSGRMNLAVQAAGALRIPMSIRSSGAIEFYTRDGLTGWDMLPLARGQMLLETTFERLLRGTLDSKTAVPVTVTYNFGSDATDNNGVATWSGGSWSSAASYRSNNNAAGGDYVEWVFRTAGTNSIVLDHGGGVFLFDTAVAVTLDGVAKTAWNQSTNQTYTLTNVAAGVHTLRLTKGATATVLHISTLQFSALPYQGVGVAGDGFTVVCGLPYVLVNTRGVGPANAAATPTRDYAPSIVQRMPMGSTANDTTLAGTAVSIAGWAGVSATMLRLPIIGNGMTFGEEYPPPYCGDALVLTANAATRGRRVTGSGGTNRALLAAALNGTGGICDGAWAALVRIDTPGAGSAFSSGDLALFVVNCSYTTAAIGAHVIMTDGVFCGADLFKLPSDLL